VEDVTRSVVFSIHSPWWLSYQSSMCSIFILLLWASRVSKAWSWCFISCPQRYIRECSICHCHALPLFIFTVHILLVQVGLLPMDAAAAIRCAYVYLKPEWSTTYSEAYICSRVCTCSRLLFFCFVQPTCLSMYKIRVHLLQPCSHALLALFSAILSYIYIEDTPFCSG